MHNTYFSSAVYSVRCKESFPLSFNGCSNLSYERFDRTLSHCSSCCGYCDCCALSTYRVPTKPYLLNGLRQSSLLQLSASRRLIFGGGDQYFSGVPTYGLLRRYEVKCSSNDRTVCNRNRRRMKERCFCAASQKGKENFPSCGSDDSEIILSFLSEEADKDATDVKWKDVSSSKRIEAEKKRKNVSRERHLSLSEKIKTERKGNLKQNETSSIDFRRECEKPNNDREAFTKGENGRKQRNFSSCSSYYSISSGDFESDLEANHTVGSEELSLGHEKDEANHMERKVKEEFNRQRDELKVNDVSNRERALGLDANWNIRKKSEKKLTTESTIQETKSTSEHQDMHQRAAVVDGSGYGETSTSHKQVHCKEDNSSFVENLDKKTNISYIQTSNRRMHQSTVIQESGCEEVATTMLSGKTFRGKTSDEHEQIVRSTSITGKESLKSKKTFSGKEGNLKTSETLLQERSDEQKKFVGSTYTTQDVIDRSSQKYIGNSNIEETASDTRMKTAAEKKISTFSSAQGAESQYYKGEKVISHAKDRRRKSQQFSEVSQAHGKNVEDTLIVNSKTNVKNREESSSLSSDARDTRIQTVRRPTQSFQHSKGSEHGSTFLEGYASNEKEYPSSQITSCKMRFIPKSKLIPVVKTRESSSQTDERIFEFTNVDQRHRNLSTISDEIASKEKSSFQGSLNSVSETGKQVILPEGDERSSAKMLIPPSSQMGRVSTYVEHTAGNTSPDISIGTSESGSSALYENSRRSPALLPGSYSQYESDNLYSEPSNVMPPEDVLGSANRFEESSKQFVDEFIERARHEVTTAEREEMEVAGTKLAFDVEGYRIDNSTQQGTQNDSHLKNHASSTSHSTGFPEAKGPSDEMWDVTKASVEHGLVADEPEINKETAKPIVSRTGRSLWSTIADIVRFRWGLHSGSSTSAGRSGERNSPNKSDVETWFSGQEHEETGKSNVMKETSVLPQTMTSDKSKPGTHHTQSEGEMSSTKKLKDKGKHIEVGSSCPNKFESGSTSIGASYASGEENVSWTEDVKDLKVTTSGIKLMESPVSLSARGHPIAGEIVNISGSDMSRIESVVPIKELVSSPKSELSGSERRDGELKQRKLQRNRQVLRDRFDDWEDAYKLELEQRRIDEVFMNEALLEARKAADTWEVPVGAVLVQHGKIIARGCNLVEELRDSTAHAEMICIREASKHLHSWRLSETTLYVTLEPCPMCAGAILQARVDTVVWGAPNKLLGADGSWIRLFPDGGETSGTARDMPPPPVHPFHPKIKIRRGVLATECADVMQQFFQLRRKNKKEELPKEPSSLRVTHHNPSKLLNKLHDIFHVMLCL